MSYFSTCHVALIRELSCAKSDTANTTRSSGSNKLCTIAVLGGLRFGALSFINKLVDLFEFYEQAFEPR